MGQVRSLYQWVTVLWLRATNIIEGYNVAAAQLKVTVQFRAMLLQHVKIAYIGDKLLWNAKTCPAFITLLIMSWKAIMLFSMWIYILIARLQAKITTCRYSPAD